jgi:hypothetical protein
MSLAYMGIPDRCEHGEYEDKECPQCELKRLRDAVAYLRENVIQTHSTNPYVYAWQPVWEEFKRRVDE